MYDFLEHLLRPFTLLSLLTILSLINLWRPGTGSFFCGKVGNESEPSKASKKRCLSPFRRRLVLHTIPLIALLLISTPAVAHLALGSLEWQYPLQESRPAEAQVIVVLSAGMRYDPGKGRAELDEDTMLRCLYAAELYRSGQACPVLVSGGKPDPELPGPSSAEVMADLLARQGVKSSDLILEAESRTTYENAVECARLLESRKLQKALLVVDAVDMHRAVCCFRKQGVDVIPAPCHYRTSPFNPSFFTFVPSPGPARNFQRAWHEWLGMAWYAVRGRI